MKFVAITALLAIAALAPAALASAAEVGACNSLAPDSRMRTLFSAGVSPLPDGALVDIPFAYPAENATTAFHLGVSRTAAQGFVLHPEGGKANLLVQAELWQNLERLSDLATNRVAYEDTEMVLDHGQWAYRTDPPTVHLPAHSITTNTLGKSVEQWSTFTNGRMTAFTICDVVGEYAVPQCKTVSLLRGLTLSISYPRTRLSQAADYNDLAWAFVTCGLRHGLTDFN